MPPTLTLDPEGRLDIASFYDPLPVQNPLHVSPAKNLLAIGGNGSGKSFFLLGEAVYVMSEFPGADVLLLRRDFKELDKGLIHDFKAAVPEELYSYNGADHVAKWFNGSTLFFGHLQNASERTLAQYLSSAFVWIGIDELGQFSFNAWSFLSSRNRVNKGCQPNADGNMPICRMGAATNPLGPGYGWIKTTWVDKKPVSQMGDAKRGPDGRWYQEDNGKQLCVYDPAEYQYVHSTVLDNPFQMEKDPHYIEKLQKLPPALRQKALHGDLNAVSGSYFANFTQERNVRSLPRDKEQIRFEDWQPVWIGFDWGLAHHSAIFWSTRCKLLGLDGQWHPIVLTYREMIVNEEDYQRARYSGKMKDDWGYKQWLAHEIYNRMEEKERAKLRYIFLAPERFARVDETSHTVASELTRELKALGLPGCSAANDARVDGAQLIYNLIDSGELVILDGCPVLISSLETRVHDNRDVLGAKLEDVLKTEDELDDAYDGERYNLLSMLKERGKPEEVKLAERAEKILDPTSRMLYLYQHRLDAERRAQPIKPRIEPRWRHK